MGHLGALPRQICLDQAKLLLVSMVDFRDVSIDGFQLFLARLINSFLQVEIVFKLPDSFVLVPLSDFEEVENIVVLLHLLFQVDQFVV